MIAIKSTNKTIIVIIQQYYYGKILYLFVLSSHVLPANSHPMKPLAAGVDDIRYHRFCQWEIFLVLHVLWLWVQLLQLFEASIYVLNYYITLVNMRSMALAWHPISPTVGVMAYRANETSSLVRAGLVTISPVQILPIHLCTGGF